MTDQKHLHQIDEKVGYINKPKEGISYYTPLQDPIAGTALDPQPDGKSIPLLFQPLKIRGMTMQNRIMLSPLCQYSATDGHLTDWHLVHLGGIISRGPGLAMVEATSVTENGRITSEDSGLWKDSQIAPLKRIVEFAHSQGQNIAIQLAHAGKKASTVAPWLSRKAYATKEGNGWPDNIDAPSAIPYDREAPTPKEMSLEDIEQLKKDWVAAVKRSLKAGFDAVEIHTAHGYLLHEFCSPATNHRTDKYGGSFENRIRLILELAELTRQNVPSDMPVFLRMTGSDWLEHLPDTPSWKTEDAVKMALALAKSGNVDFLDVSSGGVSPEQKIDGGPGYQTPFAKAIREALDKEGFTKDKILVGSVGSITKGKQANEYLEEGRADVIVSGRGFIQDPFQVWTWAEDLGIEIHLAAQHGWGFGKAKHKI